MPTYDYKCKACGHRWELFQSMTAKPEKACPKCGKKSAERLIGTGAAVLFKGGGFYQTDYRSDSYKKAAEADSKASKPAETSTTPAAATPSASTTPANTPAPATSPKQASQPAPNAKTAARKSKSKSG